MKNWIDSRMMTRRGIIKSGLATLGGLMLSKRAFALSVDRSADTFVMPDESMLHKQTWMAYVADKAIWSKRQIPEVKRNLALIAGTIAKYEPVSMLVSKQDMPGARQALDAYSSSLHPITLVEFAVDDLWLRDTGPTFAHDIDGAKVAIDFNFNGWGNKQRHQRDQLVARFIAKQSQSELVTSNLVLEGGCFEVDGHGTAIMTKSCIINDNRNPGVSQKDIDAELKALLGLRKIIWLEGVKGRDITDGHTDFYARFIRPGEVLVSRDNYQNSFDYQVTRENIRQLEQETDASGQKIKLSILDTPDVINERFGVSSFAAGYIGYYLCNGAVIAQKFGDPKADLIARKTLAKVFPDRVIEQLSIDGIASGGGSVHCATQQEIREFS